MALTILIVDDEENFRIHISEYLTTLGYESVGVGTFEQAKQHLKIGDGDMVLLDVQLPDGYGPDLLKEVSRYPTRPPVIMITGYGDIEMAVDAMKSGAHDFLTKPIQLDRLEQSLHRAKEVVAMRRELDHLRSSQQQSQDFIIGQSRQMNEVISYAKRAADASVSVLITGETGTGKEILASYIHRNGVRSQKPFIDINCAAIQTTVLESELFGYEAGAFTGAERRKHGLMEVADDGILFLDEISSMPIDMQAKLLRALEEKTIRRVGATKNLSVDVQIIAASNRDLPKLIENGQFREDLYYRLKVVNLELPPLRDRRADIPELVGFLIRKHNARLGVNVNDISQKALEMLIQYDWPGNIRELSNVIERALLFCDEAVIDTSHLSSDITRR